MQAAEKPNLAGALSAAKDSGSSQVHEESELRGPSAKHSLGMTAPGVFQHPAKARGSQGHLESNIIQVGILITVMRPRQARPSGVVVLHFIASAEREKLT